MTDDNERFIEIIGMGEAAPSSTGNAVRFLLETKDQDPIRLMCATEGLEILIAALTGLHQEAIAKKPEGPSDEKQMAVVQVQQIGSGPAENSLDVILSLKLATGTSLNVALPPELAREFSERLISDASIQLAKMN